MALEVTLSDEQDTALRAYIAKLIRKECEKVAEEEQQRRPVLSQSQAAEWAGVSTPTLKRWQAMGLKYSLINNRPYYLKENIIEFVRKHEI